MHLSPVNNIKLHVMFKQRQTCCWTGLGLEADSVTRAGVGVAATYEEQENMKKELKICNSYQNMYHTALITL